MSSFESNILSLLRLKQEALNLKMTYSKDIVNCNYQEQLDESDRELHLANSEVKMLKYQAQETSHVFNELAKELKAYNEDLKKENTQLNNANSALMAEIQKTEQTLHLQGNGLSQQLAGKDAEINRYKREIENLKLMHSQELYILKKNVQKMK